MEPQLAIYGGNPVRSHMLSYGQHELDEADINAVCKALRSDRITTGSRIPEFEDAVARYVGAKHAVAFSSGTAALHGAAFAAGLGPGDEAITTPLTFAATANCVAYQGGTPVFAEVTADTLNISPEDIERKLTPRTKAILPVDFAGRPAELDEIMSLAERRGLVVIEDACHGLGAEYKERRLGSISHMSVLSFHPVKHITTGEGGMVLTDDENLARRMRTFRHHGIEYPPGNRPWNYQISEIGYNYRITDFQCALGLSQLDKLGGFLVRRDKLARRYLDKLAGSRFVTVVTPPDYVRHGWHIFVILLNLDQLTVDRDMIMEALQAENIGVQLHYPLVHLHPYYRRTWGYGDGLCPDTEAIGQRLITLPLYPGMTDQDQDDVLSAMEKAFTHFARTPIAKEV